jgi:hypothetical protein
MAKTFPYRGHLLALALHSILVKFPARVGEAPDVLMPILAGDFHNPDINRPIPPGSLYNFVSHPVAGLGGAVHITVTEKNIAAGVLGAKPPMAPEKFDGSGSAFHGEPQEKWGRPIANRPRVLRGLAGGSRKDDGVAIRQAEARFPSGERPWPRMVSQGRQPRTPLAATMSNAFLAVLNQNL